MALWSRSASPVACYIPLSTSCSFAGSPWAVQSGNCHWETEQSEHVKSVHVLISEYRSRIRSPCFSAGEADLKRKGWKLNSFYWLSHSMIEKKGTRYCKTKQKWNMWVKVISSCTALFINRFPNQINRCGFGDYLQPMLFLAVDSKSYATCCIYSLEISSIYFLGNISRMLYGCSYHQTSLPSQAFHRCVPFPAC